MTFGLPHLSATLVAKLGSIRGRLTLWYVLLLAITLVGYSAILAVSLARGLDTGLDRILADEARQAIGVVNTVGTDAELKEEFRRINVGTIISLYDADGQQLIVGRPLPSPYNVVEPLNGEQSRLETLSLEDGTSWRVLVQSVRQPGQPDRLLQVARSAGYVDVALNQLLMLIAVTAPIVLLVAIAGGVFLAARALNPIEQMTRTAETISAEDMSRRLSLGRPHDEVGRLATTFDRMLERLNRSFEQQRRFTADASHELRTPLAMLVSRAGLALERRRSAEEYERVLQEIRDEGMRMGRVVNDLLMLARADAGDALAVSERLDAAELVASVVEAMTPLASERGVFLRQDAEEGLVLTGDQTRLMQLLVNLIDNALAHTPAGGKVLVALFRDSECAVLEVMDTGAGIRPEHIPHVFERFYRGDRDGRAQRPGAGLGLSLCQSIARAHGGDIHIASQPGKGTQVTVRLPLAAAESGMTSKAHARWLATPADVS
jgi:heavy metal sensor kinase